MNLGLSLIANMDYILAGMFKDQYQAAKDLDSKQQAFTKLMYEDIRQVYDNYMPNIHILDADNAAKLIVTGIINDPSTVLSISDDSYIPEIQAALIKAAPKLRKDIRDGIGNLHAKFALRVGNTNPVRMLNAKLSLYLRQVTRSSSGLLDSSSYLKIGEYFNSLVNQTFPKNTALLGISSESVGIVARPNRYVFFQKSFLSGKDTINQNITSILKESLDKVADAVKYANITQAKSVTGKFIDFGHVGTREAGATSININTPALVKIVYNVTNLSTEVIKVSRRDADQAKAIFIKKTGHVSQAIDINKTFNTRSRSLISIGMTTTTDMDSEFNRQILGAKEGYQSDKATADKFNSSELMRQALVSRLQNTFLGKNINKLVVGKSSYSLNDYIAIILGSSLKGQVAKSYRQKVSKSKNSSVPTKVLANLGEGIKAIAASQPKKLYASTPTSKIFEKPEVINLTSLQLLINNQLQDVISANMGDGSSRNVLNYRTGRLASSATVERLSESRTGMITAFYSYMKNPYATFSDGGKQQNPKSRDPKLLISKSIREIAAQQVGNRLRAVNI
jgi:hypothetical protein